MKGVITKGIGGFYYVDTGESIIECRARGRFRLDKVTPLVGDVMEIEIDEKSNQGYIKEIDVRKNQMLRPVIANVDQVIMVFAAKKPDINMLLLQKFLVYAEFIGLHVVVCINKIDLDKNKDYEHIVDMIKSIPYIVIETSSTEEIGINELREQLKGKISVFAGPSGAGKSSLLNRIQKGLQLKTGEISKKIDRGTHTTRQTELVKLDGGGLLADTPGFTSLDLAEIKAEDLRQCLPEFDRYNDCRFNGCMHNSEPDCAVKEAVKEGYIFQERYDYYINILNETKNVRRY